MSIMSGLMRTMNSLTMHTIQSSTPRKMIAAQQKQGIAAYPWDLRSLAGSQDGHAGG